MGKHFVELRTYSPRMKAWGYTQKEVSERDLKKVQFSDVDAMLFGRELLLGYRFFDRTDTVENGKEIIGKRENVTGWFYFKEALNMCKKWYGRIPKIE